MSHDDSEATEGSEHDQFDTIGREIASLLRITHESSTRIQTEAGEQATRTLAKADEEAARRLALAEEQATERLALVEERAAERLAEFEQESAESTRRLEDAAAMLRRSRAIREQTTQEAEALVQSVLELVDAADAQSSRLVSDVDEWRSQLTTIRTGLLELPEHTKIDGPADLEDTDLAETGVQEPDLEESDAEETDADLADGNGRGEPEASVIDLRDADPVSTTSTEPEPLNQTGDAPTGDTVLTEDRVSASVRSAVNRAIDQVLSGSSRPAPPSNQT